MPNHRPRAGVSLALSLGLSAIAIAMVAPAASAAPPRTVLISQNSAGAQSGSSGSFSPDISANGRFVVFNTDAGNFVAGDGGGNHDVFIRDVYKGTTGLISKAIGGGPGNDDSYGATISANGRFVAFTSEATDLVSPATSGEQVFVRDRWKGTTELISRSTAGTPGNLNSQQAVISANGRWVAFVSSATNLVSKNTFSSDQVYLFDRVNKVLRLVSRNKAGTAGTSRSFQPAINGNGRFVAFASEADNLSSKSDKGFAQVYRWDRFTGKVLMLSLNRYGGAANADADHPAISGNGSRVVYNSTATNLVRDTNGTADTFMRLVGPRRTSRVSVTWRGRQLNGSPLYVNTDPDISANGRYVTFESSGTNALRGVTILGGYDHIYVRDLVTRKITLVSRHFKRANGESGSPKITPKGEFVAFESIATNLVSGGDLNGSNEDVFRRGRLR